MLPDGWKLTKLEKLGISGKSPIKAGPFGSSLKKEFYVKSGYKVYGQEQVIAGNLSIGNYYIDSHRFESLKSCAIESGDILISLVGTFGKALVVPKTFEPGIINPRLIRLSLDSSKTDPFFIKEWLVSPATQNLLNDVAHGGTMGVINAKTLKSLPLLLPPLAEQKKIAAILSGVDEAIASTQAVIEQTHKVKQGLLQQLLTCGIGHTKFKYSAIGKTPEGWGVLPLANLCYKITDGSHQAVKTSKDGKIPFLYVSCVRDGKILWENTARISFETYNDISKGREPKPGVVLYTAVGSYGHAALVHTNTPFSFQRHIAYILPNPDKIYSEFISIFLNSSIGRKYADIVAVGNAQKTVTLQQLSSFPLPVPPLAEQKKIIEIISTFENILSISENRLQMLSEIKHGLMQDLLTGRVRVNT